MSVLGLILVLIALVLLIANSQDGSVKVLQTFLYKTKWHYLPNSFEPLRAPTDEVLGDGLRIKTDIRYGNKYPNSYLDIWYSKPDIGIKRPTIIYLHGGGWFMGDKTSGDPMMAGSSSKVSADSHRLLVKQGFNFVNVNYALSPEHRYPVQMNQLNEAIGFLSEHAVEYGVDMSNVVLMGGSAGAHMVAQYGLLLSDSAYAAQVGIVPMIDPSKVKALVIYSAPFDLSPRGWRFDAMMWAYLGTKDLLNSKQVLENNIVSHVGPRYPATYLTDGNQPDTFPQNAKAMARRLRDKNVDFAFTYFEPSEALLGHGYSEDLSTKQGRENLEKTIAFIRQRTGQSNGAADQDSQNPSTVTPSNH